MYRSEKFNPSLFGKLFHLGEKLAQENRWLKLADLLPWEKLDAEYGRYFSAGQGRPARDSRLVCGLLAVKQLKGVSDEDAVAEFMESPYIQSFCGLEYFELEQAPNPGMLSERRKRLGPEFLALLDAELSAALKTDKSLKFRNPKAPAPEPGLLDVIADKLRGLFGK